MISRIAIRNLGVIDEASVELGNGFTVITGETGAGKTMLLTGLALLSGARADASVVRAGADRAEVDGEWTIAASAALTALLEDAGAATEGSALLLGRTIAAEGRSRAFAQGRTVPAAILEALAEELVAVHGQADQMGLRRPAEQRQLLDRYAGTEHLECLARYREAFARWQSIAAEWELLLAERSAREREAGMLAIGIEEIEAVAPLPGEDEDLDAQASRLANAGALLESVDAAHRALVDEDGGLMDALARALHAVERASAIDASLDDLRSRLREIAGLATEAAAELAGYAAEVEADPLRHDWLQDRRAKLGALKRRYGGSLQAVQDWLQDARDRVESINGDDERIAELQQQAAHIEAQVRGLAGQLSETRRAAARALGAAITEELAGLAMAEAEVSIAVDAGRELGPTGGDEVELRLRTHQGAEFRPLAKSASGGELSRVMLALEVALAGSSSIPTFVFDEVDAGVGGRAAVEVGRRLARLAKSAQVLVVTHLPQVAAFADHHLVVEKRRGSTATVVRPVHGEDRVSELVRMLSGLDGSRSGAEHARELLEAAARDLPASGASNAPEVGR